MQAPHHGILDGTYCQCCGDWLGPAYGAERTCALCVDEVEWVECEECSGEGFIQDETFDRFAPASCENCAGAGGWEKPKRRAA